MPLTLEFAPTLRCNLRCPTCPYRDARARREAGAKWIRSEETVVEDGITVTTMQIAKAVLTASRDAGVRGAIFTGGGEPTTWPHLPEGIRLSARLGMANALYTNAVLLGRNPKLAQELLHTDCRMVFVRASINAVSDAVAKKFSGAKSSDVRAQCEGLSALFETRRHLLSAYAQGGSPIPSIQVSIIIDENNVDDLASVCRRVSKIAKSCGGGLGKDDVVIVRPLTKHGKECYSICDHDDVVIEEILAVCGKNGSMRGLIVDAGLNLYLGFGLENVDSGSSCSYADVLLEEYKNRDLCWANGIFLTVAPDATVHLCVDHNCYKEWAIGNLMEQSVEEIYAGPRRTQLLERVHEYRCGPEVCEATCRTPRLNRIARMIRSGELTDADIAEIRARTLDDPPLLLS